MGSLIRATNLWGYDDLVRQMGSDPARFLERYHIPVASERPDESFVSYRNMALLLETTAFEMDRQDFGMRLARWQGLEILGAIAVIARNSRTILDALRAISRYLYTHSPALTLSIEESTESIRLDFRISELTTLQLRQSYELSMANSVQILKLLAGESAVPDKVCFLHGQVGPLQSYAACFGCEVHFDQTWCGLQLPANIAVSPIDHADSQTLHYATKFLESRFPPGSEPLSSRVRELIRRLLPTGQCNADTIAAELAMHSRTLQRKLAAEELRYDQLVDRERRKLAEQYLGESGMHMVQIAGLLGYTEQSTFSRACVRWFGLPPRKYREQRDAHYSGLRE